MHVQKEERDKTRLRHEYMHMYAAQQLKCTKCPGMQLPPCGPIVTKVAADRLTTCAHLSVRRVGPSRRATVMSAVPAR
jgi:hypothetical protein